VLIQFAINLSCKFQGYRLYLIIATASLGKMCSSPCGSEMPFRMQCATLNIANTVIHCITKGGSGPVRGQDVGGNISDAQKIEIEVCKSEATREEYYRLRNG
jgi:hypothetical protein